MNSGLVLMNSGPCADEQWPLCLSRLSFPGDSHSQQATGLVPIVEPEILIDGDHDMAAFAHASHQVISQCVAQLWQQVKIPGSLKKGCALQYTLCTHVLNL